MCEWQRISWFQLFSFSLISVASKWALFVPKLCFYSLSTRGFFMNSTTSDREWGIDLIREIYSKRVSKRRHRIPVLPLSHREGSWVPWLLDTRKVLLNCLLVYNNEKVTLSKVGYLSSQLPRKGRCPAPRDIGGPWEITILPIFKRKPLIWWEPELGASLPAGRRSNLFFMWPRVGICITLLGIS